MKGSKRYAKATICCMAVLASDWSCLVRTIGMHYDGVPCPTRTLWQEITAPSGVVGFAKLLKGIRL